MPSGKRRKADPGQPLGPLGSRRREGYLLRLSGGTGGYWNVVLRLPGSCTISCPKQPPRDLHVSSSGATPDLSLRQSVHCRGSGFERRCVRMVLHSRPGRWSDLPGYPGCSSLRRTASADPPRRASPNCRRSCPIPIPTIARRPAGSGSLNEPAPAGQTPDHRICDDRGRPQFRRARIRTVPKSAEPMVDGSVAMASRLAAWDKGDLKKRQRAESR